jgi:hypothetical protein
MTERKRAAVKKLRLNMADIFKLHTALHGLDRYADVVDGKPVERPFKIGAARYDVARNVAVLQVQMDAFEKARLALAREHSEPDAAAIRPEDPGWPAFSKEFQKMSDFEHVLNQRVIMLGSLVENPFPVLVLATLEQYGILRVEGEDDGDGDGAEDEPK